MTRQRSRLSVYAGFVVVVLVMYVLSMGPMFGLAIRVASRPGPDLTWPTVAWSKAYAPVLYVASRDPQLKRAAIGYISFWDLRGPPSPPPGPHTARAL